MKNIKIIKKTIASFFFLGFLFIFSLSASAFEKTKLDLEIQNDFIVEPGKTEIFINPGETVTKSITITSRIDKEVNFKLNTEDMIGTNDSQSTIKLLGDEVGPYSVKNFIKPEITEFTLSLGERIVIPVEVSVPVDAEPRGYYGALIVSNEPDILEKGEVGGARLVSRIGALFLVRINGEGVESGSLIDFKIIGPQKGFYQKNPSGFEIAFKNDGNVHLVPYGKISIKNIFGKDVSFIPVDAYFSLPDSIRYREVLYEKSFGFGKYTAKLSLFPGYGNKEEEMSISFWVIPWKILAITFVGLVFIISLLYYVFTRFELKRK